MALCGAAVSTTLPQRIVFARSLVKASSCASTIQRKPFSGSLRHRQQKAQQAADAPPQPAAQRPLTPLPNLQGSRDDAVEETRDFIFSILRTSATKREAKAYLKQFGSKPTSSTPAVAEFVQSHPSSSSSSSSTAAQDRKSRNQEYLQHLFKTNQPTYFKRPSNSAETFLPDFEEDQIHLAVVKIREVDKVDDATLRAIGRTLRQLRRLGLVACVVVDGPHNGSFNHSAKIEQAERVAEAIEKERGRARVVDCSVWIDFRKEGDVSIALPNLLIAPISRGVVPVITTTGCDWHQRLGEASADGIILALSRLFGTRSGEAQKTGLPTSTTDYAPIVLDRIIFLDPLGGIPSPAREGRAHVYINLKQEFDDVIDELSTYRKEDEIHRQNLQTINKALSYLSDEASAIITSPTAAGTYVGSQGGHAPPREKARNPLIHNFLTNKPIISSSLPPRGSPTITTLVKLGLPLKILRCSSLKNPEVDLDKLVYLINDSFGRDLDVEKYLERVDGKIAALIIAGDYEGAAIVTWETPPGGGEPVAYLDKFAVLRKSQGGGGGVADLVFKAMVMGVFPKGILWRSRRENIVNRWYFERAKGHWILPDKKWTMFWTVNEDELSKRFMDYVGICSSIIPTWKN